MMILCFGGGSSMMGWKGGGARVCVSNLNLDIQHYWPYIYHTSINVCLGLWSCDHMMCHKKKVSSTANTKTICALQWKRRWRRKCVFFNAAGAGCKSVANLKFFSLVVLHKCLFYQIKPSIFALATYLIYTYICSVDGCLVFARHLFPRTPTASKKNMCRPISVTWIKRENNMN